MKSRGYRFAVRWIAAEDEPTELDAEAMHGQLTVALVADLFGVEVERVAADVVRRRKLEARGIRLACDVVEHSPLSDLRAHLERWSDCDCHPQGLPPGERCPEDVAHERGKS